MARTQHMMAYPPDASIEWARRTPALAAYMTLHYTLLLPLVPPFILPITNVVHVHNSVMEYGKGNPRRLIRAASLIGAEVSARDAMTLLAPTIKDMEAKQWPQFSSSSSTPTSTAPLPDSSIASISPTTGLPLTDQTHLFTSSFLHFPPAPAPITPTFSVPYPSSSPSLHAVHSTGNTFPIGGYTSPPTLTSSQSLPNAPVLTMRPSLEAKLSELPPVTHGISSSLLLFFPT
jgi:hypothetical protein